MKYVQTHFAEEQQKVKIYPLLVCLWGNLTMDEKSEKNRYEIFDQTFQLLRRRKSLYCLLDIMRLRILSGVKEKRSMTREQGELQILQSFFEEFGYQAKSQIYVPQANEIMLEHVGQYLSTERKKVNFTQEKISDGICSVESYSRIENGRKPTRNNYKALTENISEINKSDLTIDLAFDKENRTLTVTDHGIGMNKEELEEHLGTIANSGSFKFKNETESDDIDIIGQFGVGFYSAFMVAKKVEVIEATNADNDTKIMKLK